MFLASIWAAKVVPIVVKKVLNSLAICLGLETVWLFTMKLFGNEEFPLEGLPVIEFISFHVTLRSAFAF